MPKTFSKKTWLAARSRVGSLMKLGLAMTDLVVWCGSLYRTDPLILSDFSAVRRLTADPAKCKGTFRAVRIVQFLSILVVTSLVTLRMPSKHGGAAPRVLAEPDAI